MLSCSACCRGVVVAAAAGVFRVVVVVVMLASRQCARRCCARGYGSKGQWLATGCCVVRLCCGRDACQVGAGSVGRVPVLCVREWVGGWCGSSWVNQPRAGLGPAAVAVCRDGGE